MKDLTYITTPKFEELINIIKEIEFWESINP